jgi:hypothetical protein
LPWQGGLQADAAWRELGRVISRRRASSPAATGAPQKPPLAAWVSDITQLKQSFIPQLAGNDCAAICIGVSIGVSKSGVEPTSAGRRRGHLTRPDSGGAMLGPAAAPLYAPLSGAADGAPQRAASGLPLLRRPTSGARLRLGSHPGRPAGPVPGVGGALAPRAAGVDRKPAGRKNHSATSWCWSLVGSRWPRTEAATS